MALINCKECGAQVSTQAKTCPNCGAKVKKPTSKLTWIILGVIVFGILASMIGGESTTSSDGTKTLSPKEQALQDVKFDFDWSKAGFDNIMMIDMTVKNTGTRDVKDFEVECNHTSNSGTKIDSNKRQVFEIVKAGETRTFKNFNMGFIHSQASSSSCAITDLVVI
ncbi:zinc ribbon domain-containing protein [Acinetobacter soli]|uniref:zinc ribbon domain-containing protein n=1 Tax=Acinetobacter soli TaxID=487316 RepID=UPI00124F8EC1|nr:zinc-ribbon domain-containing protein [Acinetobacter soli]WEH92317.1 zinc ribbon domain-containing protein [Acinetobacter soli]WEH98518.1 zinc ribbon domain-containing protein [Acinetobacter soli]WEI00887.1 zinc ribbon domain-containing protein [Acinetobacter soli]